MTNQEQFKRSMYFLKELTKTLKILNIGAEKMIQ